MRKNIDEILKGVDISYSKEYDVLYGLLHNKLRSSFPALEFSIWGSDSLWDVVNKTFQLVPTNLRGTSMYLGDFESPFLLPNLHECRSLDELLTAIECWASVIIATPKEYVDCHYKFDTVRQIFLNYISTLVEKLEHRFVKNNNGLWLLIPVDLIKTTVVSELPKDIQIKTLEYYHRSMKGNLENKKSVLRSLGKELEAHRAEVEGLCGPIASDAFCILNNLDIRHANADQDSKSYHVGVAALANNELERYYDDLYELMIAAFACYYCKEIRKNDMPKIKALSKT